MTGDRGNQLRSIRHVEPAMTVNHKTAPEAQAANWMRERGISSGGIVILDEPGQLLPVIRQLLDIVKDIYRRVKCSRCSTRPGKWESPR